MRLPNWFRVVWWLLALGGSATAVYLRLPSILAGTTTATDTALIGIFAALAVVPIFSEIDLLGVKLKSEIKELKQDLERQMTMLRAEVRAEIKTEISPSIYLQAPPRDAELPNLEHQIREAVGVILKENGVAAKPPKELPAPPSTEVRLFTIRRTLEAEIRRIWDAAAREGWFSPTTISEKSTPRPVTRLLDQLVEAKMVDAEIARGVREVYAICSAAIHGQPVTDRQFAFADAMSSILFPALAAIK